MSKQQAEQVAHEMYRRGEIDRDTLDMELASIAYAYAEQQTARDRRVA